jgi:hypothetical protein
MKNSTSCGIFGTRYLVSYNNPKAQRFFLGTFFGLIRPTVEHSLAAERQGGD